MNDLKRRTATTGAPTGPDDPMMAGGKELTLPELWNAGESGKRMRQGDALMGTLESFKGYTHPTFGAVRLAIFTPAMLRRGEQFEEYDRLAVVLTKFLVSRLDSVTHVGRTFTLRYAGKQDVGKGNPMHAYDVVEQPRETLDKLRAFVAKEAGVTDGEESGAGDNDLPFSSHAI